MPDRDKARQERDSAEGLGQLSTQIAEEDHDIVEAVLAVAYELRALRHGLALALDDLTTYSGA